MLIKCVCFLFLIVSFNTHAAMSQNKNISECSDNCNKVKSSGAKFTCKLTTSELRERKEKVISKLKVQILETKELKNGYAYKFYGSDQVVDELSEFIKTERECCDFFTFNLSISGDKSITWLEIVGPKGAKKFIETELDL